VHEPNQAKCCNHALIPLCNTPITKILKNFGINLPYMGDLLNFALVKCQSPVLYWDIAAREFAVHANTIHMHNQTPNPDSQRVNTLLFRRFPYREIGGCGVECLLQHKTPNPETPTARHLSSTYSRGPRCHVTLGISRIANP
jgi:hypothetical protein